MTFDYTTTKFSEFVDAAEFFELLFIFECPMLKGYTSDQCVDCIEILRKYKDALDLGYKEEEKIAEYICKELYKLKEELLNGTLKINK